MIKSALRPFVSGSFKTMNVDARYHFFLPKMRLPRKATAKMVVIKKAGPAYIPLSDHGSSGCIFKANAMMQSMA
jgi:hypothetical protein